MSKKNTFESIENELLSEEIKKKGIDMADVYSKLYVIENTLRSFIIKTFEQSHGPAYWSKVKLPNEVSKSISIRKTEQSKNNWLPLRGESEIYYTDLVDVGGIVNNNWELFKSCFPDQPWIISKLNELSKIRNLVAHNSFVGNDEIQLLEVYFKLILKQIRAITHSSLKDNSSLVDNNENQFIIGLKKSSVFEYKQLLSGQEFLFDFDNFEVAPICLRCFMSQSDFVYYAIFKDTKVHLTYLLNTDLEIAKLGEPLVQKDYCRYQFGQYDIDGDGIDEVFIGIQDPNESALQINVLKYFPPALSQHANRIENWSSIGNMKVENVLGEPKAFVKDLSITIPRNLRSFYHEWTWVKDKFIETGFF